MAPREGCPLRSGDWCSRLSWPGTPVTSFRWDRVVTITVSPGGAASPARRDAPRRSSGIPSVRTAAPGFRRGSTLPSSCHSVRADNRARTSSRTHLRPRARPLRVQTASLQVRPPALGTCIQLAIAYDGDIPRGRVRVLPGGGIRRRRGQHSRPRARRTSPAAQKCPRTRRMSPAAAPECGASVASRATGAPTTPAPTSNHEFRAPHRRQKRPSRGRHGTPRDARVRQTLVTIPHRSGVSSPLSQQPGTLGEDRQVHPVAGTDPLLRTAQVSLDG